MPPNLPELYELQLRINGPDDGHKIGYRLVRHPVYPPPPRREQDRIVFDYNVSEIAKGATTQNLTPLINRITSEGLLQFDITGRANAVGPSLQASYREVDQVTRALFRGEGMEMLKFLLEGPTVSDDPNSQPSRLGRITFDIEDAGLRKVRWELLGILSGADWIEFGRRFIILRRYHARACELSARLDLPVNVAIKSYSDRINDDRVKSYGEEIFDDFTRQAREAGGILWGEMGGARQAEVHHLVFDVDGSRDVGEPRARTRGGRSPFGDAAGASGGRGRVLPDLLPKADAQLAARPVRACGSA
jgi:hypothetical protein